MKTSQVVSVIGWCCSGLGLTIGFVMYFFSRNLPPVRAEAFEAASEAIDPIVLALLVFGLLLICGSALTQYFEKRRIS